MKKIVLFVLLWLVLAQTKAQISGLSASKATTFSAKTVDLNCIEFEPSFCVVKEKNEFIKSFDWRFTYSPRSNFEIGYGLSSNVDELGIGAKFLFFQHDIAKIAILAGTNYDFVAEKPFQNASIGLAGTFDFVDDYSADLNLIYSTDFEKQNSLFVGFDKGIYIKSTQLIIGSIFQYDFVVRQSYLWFMPGFTFEAANNFLIVSYVPIGIIRKKSIGYCFALTIKID